MQSEKISSKKCKKNVKLNGKRPQLLFLRPTLSVRIAIRILHRWHTDSRCRVFTLCAVVFTMKRISVSAHKRTLAVVWTAMYGRYAMWMMCDLMEGENTNGVHLSAILANTAHVQGIRCLPKGSHLIHWKSAVVSHIALKWTPFAYQDSHCFTLRSELVLQFLFNELYLES